jgi:hypothetical protein
MTARPAISGICASRRPDTGCEAGHASGARPLGRRLATRSVANAWCRARRPFESGPTSSAISIWFDRLAGPSGHLLHACLHEASHVRSIRGIAQWALPSGIPVPGDPRPCFGKVAIHRSLATAVQHARMIRARSEPRRVALGRSGAAKRSTWHGQAGSRPPPPAGRGGLAGPANSLAASRPSRAR